LKEAILWLLSNKWQYSLLNNESMYNVPPKVAQIYMKYCSSKGLTLFHEK